ncbi:MAG: hypothetical protein EBW40_01650 [Gammaproteobacteria bacterium]|nr:hypothetical protein [Gammaproteobacteria bacterium]
MTAILDGLIATGATFEAVADEAGTLGYQIKERRLKPPVAGSVFVDENGLLQRVRYQFFGWVMSVDGDSKIHLTRWRKAFAVGGYVLEPELPDYNITVQWFALTLVVLARLLLVMLVSILGQVSDASLAPLWILTALILASTTYTSITLIHRSQWNDLEAALDAMAPDWIPRLSRDVGGRILAISTIFGMLLLDSVLHLSASIWVVGLGFLFLDLMPTRHFKQARALTQNPRVRTEREPKKMMSELRDLLNIKASEVGEYHFGNLMDLIGFDHWRERFGGSLNYRIGPDNQGLSSSEAAALSLARALAQGADTLILVDALAPLSADRQMELLNRLGSANCRIFVFSSVSDLWEGDVIELD